MVPPKKQISELCKHLLGKDWMTPAMNTKAIRDLGRELGGAQCAVVQAGNVKVQGVGDGELGCSPGTRCPSSQSHRVNHCTDCAPSKQNLEVEPRELSSPVTLEGIVAG